MGSFVPPRLPLTSLALLVLAATGACSSEAQRAADSSGGEAGARATGGVGNAATGGVSGSGEGATGGAGGAAAPVFLLGTRVWDDVVTTSYFHVVRSLDEGTEPDAADALEVPGPAKLYDIEGAGWFAVGDGEAPTITRYALSERSALVPGATLSLLNLGVGSLWDTLYVVSPTKMYYPDRDNSQLIVINPSEMSVEGVVDLSETVRDGYLSVYGYVPHVRAGKLLFSVGWFDWENDRVLAETGLIVLDTETDSVARFDVDDRCAGITTSVETESGDAYFASSALAGAAHRLGRLATAPCALRIRAGEDAFDASYLGDLEALTGALVAGEPVPAGGDALFLRVLDEGLATIEPGNATWEITGQAAWRWWRWDIAGETTEEIPDLAPSTSDVLWFEVDGRVYGTETTEDYSATTLVELTSEGGPRRRLTAPGFLHGVARVR